jgi:hypothetical protein
VINATLFVNRSKLFSNTIKIIRGAVSSILARQPLRDVQQ